jgi:hypothetical protein
LFNGQGDTEFTNEAGTMESNHPATVFYSANHFLQAGADLMKARPQKKIEGIIESAQSESNYNCLKVCPGMGSEIV